MVAPELRLGAFALPAVAPAIVGPTRAVVLPLAGPIMRRAAHAGHVHPARGPPRARNAPAIIDS